MTKIMELAERCDGPNVIDAETCSAPLMGYWKTSRKSEVPFTTPIHLSLREVTMKPSEEQLAGQLATDPLRFVSLCWPDMQLYDKQRDILLSLVENKETFVHAANELGKSRVAAICAIFFFASRRPARVITSSTTQAQLDSILWTEGSTLVFTANRLTWNGGTRVNWSQHRKDGKWGQVYCFVFGWMPSLSEPG
jgi:hypothetical protein